MSQLKKILISVPETLLAKVDNIVKTDGGNRSRFVREAMEAYVLEKEKKVIREQMISGYQLMHKINLDIAKEWENADTAELECYEEKLSECE